MKYVSLFLLTIMTCGCNRPSDVAVKRAETTGVPISIQSSLTRIMDNGEKNAGLAESEWAELETLVQSKDEKVRLESVTALAGISAKRTKQGERIVKFLQARESDSSEDVRDRAELIKKFHLDERAKGAMK
jgi:hypothetical protein